MANAVFNGSYVDGKQALSFPPNGMGGLLGSENPERLLIGSPSVKRTFGGYAGLNHTFQSTSGLGTRPITWIVTITASTDANLNQIESFISAYLESGSYNFTDNKGRWSENTTMTSFERIGFREKHHGTTDLIFQQIVIQLLVLSPSTAAHRL